MMVIVWRDDLNLVIIAMMAVIREVAGMVVTAVMREAAVIGRCQEAFA